MNVCRIFWIALLLAALVALAGVGPLPAVAAEDPASIAAIAQIVETFAKSAIDDGLAVGVAVGITYRGRTPQLFSYGTANVADGTPVTPDTIFEMGSVTKVFTTALLGEAVLDGSLKLNLPLSRLETLLGPMQRPTQSVTLLNLGDFTAGLPSTPPVCPPPTQMQPPGCLPNGRPSISEYGAQDLLEYFRTFAAPRMPGPYFYSDISTGLIGLILGSNASAPMGNGAVEGWIDLVRQRITDPLGMTDTFLFDDNASPDQQARMAGGYAPAMVDATAVNGELVISGFIGGRGYSSAPAVTVVGGGGSGAAVTSAIDKGAVSAVQVTNAGQGYVAPPDVLFSGGAATTTARARAIVSNGQVIGIRIVDRGAGYSPKRLPTVHLVGGTAGPNARTAGLAPATVSNGGVDFVRVIDGGAGYVDPIAVIVAPGGAFENVVPVWAPAGGLKSSARDMVAFAEAALGHQFVDGGRVSSRLRSAFQIAQKGYACENIGRPCRGLSGLAWAITPADGGMRENISKNGGLPGFSTELRLVPSLDLGIVVFVNSNQVPGEESGTKPVSTSGLIADNIMYAIAREKIR